MMLPSTRAPYLPPTHFPPLYCIVERFPDDHEPAALRHMCMPSLYVYVYMYIYIYHLHIRTLCIYICCSICIYIYSCGADDTNHKPASPIKSQFAAVLPQLYISIVAAKLDAHNPDSSSASLERVCFGTTHMPASEALLEILGCRCRILF